MTEVLRPPIVAACDQVPAGAAVADMIQRVGEAGEQEGIVFCG